MIVTKFFAKFRAVTSLFVAASVSIVAQPALANSSSADISGPVRTAQSANQSVTGGEDEQFRQLFSSWQNFEETGLAAAKPKPASVGTFSSVAIPSRNPLGVDRVSSTYGMRNHPILGGRRAHKGVDLAAPVGTPIYATADGTVSRASWFSGYGLYIAVEHGGEMQTRYAHLSRLNVADGQRVRKGDVIGYVGSTGNSTGPHLHYEVRISGEAVNPLPYMQSGMASADSNAKGG